MAWLCLVLCGVVHYSLEIWMGQKRATQLYAEEPARWLEMVTILHRSFLRKKRLQLPLLVIESIFLTSPGLDLVGVRCADLALDLLCGVQCRLHGDHLRAVSSPPGLRQSLGLLVRADSRLPRLHRGCEQLECNASTTEVRWTRACRQLCGVASRGSTWLRLLSWWISELCISHRLRTCGTTC